MGFHGKGHMTKSRLPRQNLQYSYKWVLTNLPQKLSFQRLLCTHICHQIWEEHLELENSAICCTVCYQTCKLTAKEVRGDRCEDPKHRLSTSYNKIWQEFRVQGLVSKCQKQSHDIWSSFYSEQSMNAMKQDTEDHKTTLVGPTGWPREEYAFE
jgi:hypothetical protein